MEWKISVEKILFIWTCLVFSYSCTNNSNSQAGSRKDEHTKLLIEINSPYSCFNEIRMVKGGKDTAIFGFREGDSAGRIKQIKSFAIHADSDVAAIDKMVERLLATPDIDTSRAYDLYRFTVFINDNRVVDRYGQNILLDSVLRVLLPYVQDDSNGQCDFFNLFKQTMDQQLNKKEE